MKKFTTPETIRAELSRLGYEAHGKKCMVSIEGVETEAIIHCKDVPKYKPMRWYFCQDINDGAWAYSGDKHGKEYSFAYFNDDDIDGVYWFSWIEEETKKKYTPEQEKFILDCAKNIYINYDICTAKTSFNSAEQMLKEAQERGLLLSK